jgi:hypothetical protein
MLVKGQIFWDIQPWGLVVKDVSETYLPVQAVPHARRRDLLMTRAVGLVEGQRILNSRIYQGNILS